MIDITFYTISEDVIISAGYLHLRQLGVLIAVAVFSHDALEGIATAILLTSGGCRKRPVLFLTFPSGLTEPLGALLGGTFLLDASDEATGLALSFAAGVITYITADEIISIAHERGYKHVVSIGLRLGVIS